MKRNLTCIICPIGCALEVELEGKQVISVSGNTCPRGKAYAETECTNPQRTVTTTVRCEDGRVLPVKTDRPIPKEKMSECMKIINQTVAPLPISIGDVIIKDVCGSNIVATAKAE
ncbi:MAG: DUF1667 domain-containing protein [Ruminococcaceae bacterium]|nr:DUF1667 domain-containing protein [Oscillospiraceae bacterium]